MTKTVDAPNVPHEDYTPTKRKAYHTQREVAEAWAEGLYPTHNDGVLYSTENFKGYQRPDGSGRLMHYRTREAVRTRHGLIINNRQCWATGFAHCTPPPNADATLPIGGIERVMRRGDDIYDVWGVKSNRNGTGYVLVEGYAVAVGRDASAKGMGLFAVRLDKDEAKRLVDFDEDVQSVLEDVLKPQAVQESDLPVVTSTEYTKTRLDKDELDAHRSHGGSTSKIHRGWRDDYIGNLQQYRADLRGAVIIRQGEYFFIPDYGFDPNEHEDATYSIYEQNPDSKTSYVREPRILGSHVPQRRNGIVTVDGSTWVQGSIRHEDDDHDAINLGDIWHRVVTHDREAVSIDTSPRGGSGLD